MIIFYVRLLEVTSYKVQEIPLKLLDMNLNTSDSLSDFTDCNIIVFQRADLATNSQFAYPTEINYLGCVLRLLLLNDIHCFFSSVRSVPISQMWRLNEFLKWLGEHINYDWEMIQMWRTT
jgi:hypothetical protein